MRPSAERMLMDQIKQLGQVERYTGTFLNMDGAKAICSLWGGQIETTFASTIAPSPGDSVRIELRDGAYVLTGPSRPKSMRGTVTDVTAVPVLPPPEQMYDSEGNPLPLPPAPEPLPDDVARCMVEIDGVKYPLPYDTNYTPKVGDIVAVQWGFDGGLVQGAVSMKPPPPPPVVPAPPVQQFNPGPFTATGSDSWQNGSYNKGGRVWSSDSVRGIFLYGSKIADTIPDDARINYVRLYLDPESTYGDPANLRLHSNTSFGSGPAWQGASWPLSPPGGPDWVQIPNWFGEWLRSNAGGVGFDTGGYHIFRSITTNPMSGALDINYTA